MLEDSAASVSTKVFQPTGFPTLLERYQVLGVIGQGGMATVFKAYHTNLKRFVAIKTLRIDKTKTADLVHRFLREMEAIGQMDHPNVVRASDAGEKNGVLHLVMEYLTGIDLDRLIREQGPLAEANACELTRQAALGLDYIHRTLVHRDIKPSNLMLASSGLVKILDLGLARLHEAATGNADQTPEGCVLGTYDYLAPEQANGSGRLDGRADLYSLGCTLFKLLTGRAPFSGPEYNTVPKKLFAHCHVPLTSVEGFPSIPEAVRPVLLRMTAKDPCERYTSGREAAGVLAPLATGSNLSQVLGRIDLGSTPLLQPLLEELSRLTDAPQATPRTMSTARRTPPQAALGEKRWTVLGAGILACALAATLWLLAPTLFKEFGPDQAQMQQPTRIDNNPAQSPQVGKGSSASVRALDALPAFTYHRLLDEQPVCVGAEGAELHKWRWDRDRQRLDVHWHDGLLFQLGMTSHKRFTLEVGVSQPHWTGNVGVFWGYHEDAAVRSARMPDQEFAWFQMMVIGHRTGASGEDRYFVQRGKAGLLYNELGEIVFNSRFTKKHDLPLLAAGEKTLVIDIDNDRLNRAVLGAIELTNLYSAEVNKAFAAERYRGALGLIALGHHASFLNVRFIANSTD